MIQPVRWKNNRLEILDQRLLPYQEKYLVCRTVDQVVDAIKPLAVRGAPLLGVTGAYALALAKDRPAAAKKLIASRPTGVNLRWAVERTLRAADPLDEARRIHAEDAAMCDSIAPPPPAAGTRRGAAERPPGPAAPRDEARRIHAEDAAMCDSIARHGAPLL